MTTPNEVFEYIVKYKQEHDGCAPSMRDISAEFGGMSTNTVFYHLDALAKQGKITRDFNTARFIQVVGGEWVWHGNSRTTS